MRIENDDRLCPAFNYFHVGYLMQREDNLK